MFARLERSQPAAIAALLVVAACGLGLVAAARDQPTTLREWVVLVALAAGPVGSLVWALVLVSRSWLRKPSSSSLTIAFGVSVISLAGQVACVAIFVGVAAWLPEWIATGVFAPVFLVYLTLVLLPWASALEEPGPAAAGKESGNEALAVDLTNRATTGVAEKGLGRLVDHVIDLLT